MLLSVKLKNGLTSLAEQMGMDITTHLKNITVNGQKRGCSGFVTCGDASRIGKTSIAIVCEHTVDNPLIPVTVATCRVREIYYSKEHRWRAPKYPTMTVRQAVDGFLYTPSVQQYRTPSGGISTLVVAQVARGGVIPSPPAYPAAQSYGAVPDTLRQSS